ncbi:MAG: hypothetical protein ACLFTU_09580 [Puniceicoccaceae bacterium]
MASVLFAALPAAAQNPPEEEEEELPTVRLSAAFLSSVELPDFFARGADGEFMRFTIGRNRFGPPKDVVDEGGLVVLYREREDPETGEMRKYPALRESFPEGADSVLLVFYFDLENNMQRRVIAESADGPQPRTLRLINLMDRRVGVQIQNDRLGGKNIPLNPGEDKWVDLDFKSDESFWYRYLIDLPEDEGPRRKPSWKSLSLLDRQRMLIFFANLRMVSDDFDEETGEVTDTEIFFKPTDIRVMELLR